VRRRCALPVLGTVVALLFVSAVLWPAPPAVAGTVWRGLVDGPLPVLLVWHLLQDTSPTGKPTSPDGWYLGLRRVGDTAKPAWYAFARGNHISLAAPARAPRGAHIVLSGSYASASIGGVAGRRLLIERRKGAGSWRVVARRVS
jgi:hypothetical protein